MCYMECNTTTHHDKEWYEYFPIVVVFIRKLDRSNNLKYRNRCTNNYKKYTKSNLDSDNLGISEIIKLLLNKIIILY